VGNQIIHCRAHRIFLFFRRISVRKAHLALGITGSGVHEQGDNQTVKTQDFGENENQDHADEESRLLSGTSHTSITDDTNCEASSETGKTDGQTSAELDEVGEEGGALAEIVGDQDGNDKTVNGNDTSHNDGNDVLDNQVRPEDTHGGDTNAGLGGTVGSAEAGEDDGGHAAHRSKEGGIHGAVIGRHGGG